MNWLRGTTGALLLAALATVGTTCTLLLDHSAVQCKTSDDCSTLGTYPICQNGLCVPSGLQPSMCFLANPPAKVPKLETDFLNGCSTSAMLPSLSDSADGCLTFTTPFDRSAAIKTPPAPMTSTPKPSSPPTSMCKDLVPAGKQIVYITGSSNFAPLLGELSQVIVNTISIVPVFRTTTSCTGVRSMNPTSTTYNADHYIKDPTTATDTYAQIYLGDSNNGVPCLLGSNGVPVDIGESEIAQDTCGPPANPDDSVGESQGPILPIIFVVPKLSTEKVISAAAAYQVFGGGSSVPPWVRPAFLYIRGQGTATLRLVGNEIGLKPMQFWGIDQGSASGMASSLSILSTPEDANAALGIIGTDYYDSGTNRDGLKALGFQAEGQSCAYLPDSTLTSRDKINVRDGHYPLWGRIHFFAARSNGTLSSPTATSFLSLFASAAPDPAVLHALINAGFVPACAMKVTRDTELGPFTYGDPPAVACGCAFDAQINIATLDPACKGCTTNADCTSGDRPSCRYGYCERESS